MLNSARLYHLLWVATAIITLAACGAPPAAAASARTVRYRGVFFAVPSSWAFVPVDSKCLMFRLLSPTAKSSNHWTALKGDTVGLFLYHASHTQCPDMSDFYRGAWHTVTNGHGVALTTSATNTIKVGSGVGVFEYIAIRSKNVGLQLFGYGATAEQALVVDYAIIASARIG